MDKFHLASQNPLYSQILEKFYNGATQPDNRGQGLNSALRRFSLRHAQARGCQIGLSYLSPKGMAFSLCRELGYQPKWFYRVFLAPGLTDAPS
jgi:GNAT superfamily N-acetyltransferase